MILLVEYIFKIAPKGLHDWNMFIKPEMLTSLLIKKGFSDIDLKGFHPRGRNKNTGDYRVKINNNRSLFYIGNCVKGSI